MKQVSASKFKATCLALMDEVQRTGEPIVITKRGKPVGRLVPVTDEPPPKRKLGGLRHMTTIHGDLTEPIGEMEDWEWEWAE